MTFATRRLACAMAVADREIRAANSTFMLEHWREYRELVAYRRYVLLRQTRLSPPGAWPEGSVERDETRVEV